MSTSQSQELEELVRLYRELLQLQDPSTADFWHPPAVVAERYVKVGEQLLIAFSKFAGEQSRTVLAQAQVTSEAPPEFLRIVRKEIRHRIPALQSLLDRLDPNEGNSLLRTMLCAGHATTGWGNRVSATFEFAIDRLDEWLWDDPEQKERYRYPIDEAYQVLNSKLLAFEPDKWLDRASQLQPLAISPNRSRLPPAMSLRVRELYRVYSFGCWLAVIALARSTLEFALREHYIQNSPQESSHSRKNLHDLIQATALSFPEIEADMQRIRSIGNEYFHPTPTQPPEHQLVDASRHATELVSCLVYVLDTLHSRRAEA